MASWLGDVLLATSLILDYKGGHETGSRLPTRASRAINIFRSVVQINPRVRDPD
jgi:hypothetical protein